MSHVVFQFGQLFIETEALASPLFEDVISRHGEHPLHLYRVMMTKGLRVEISDEWRAANPEDAKLIDAGNVLVMRALGQGLTAEITPK